METPNPPPEVSETDTFSHLIHGEPSMPLWDWNELIDFNDDQLGVSWKSDQPTPFDQPPIPHPSPEISDKVRKRDPRLTCPNFLAGIVPCACPELDEQLAEEERQLPRKKRVRTVRASAEKMTCQVPECEADIRELKGYHKRHKVCLRCANASAVVIDGQRKRYCQQCGKFHILSDFDEGKRSCRRKLERHNRLRRKLADSKGAVEKECQGGFSGEDVACDDEAGKDIACLSSRDAEKETLLESEDGRISTFCSAPGSQDIQSDNVFAASGETPMDRGKDDFKILSPSYCDNKSAYSSMCPTGRISFKLYDWNPAEFPRRLRHQIFQWLASMPVELEGYIRPGCTILTVFIAMPKVMWIKLSEDPATYIHDFVVAPGKMLSGRGTLFVYLNDLIFRVRKDEISVMEKVRPPKLHYVHPTCFEAGKPIEFVACGSNLLQPKFRFLVSFAGKYLPHDYCVPLPYGKAAGVSACGFDHQLYKINIPCTETGLFGPAFIEVENQSGLSNFIPILIGDKEICYETKTIQQNLDASLYSKGSQFAAICSLSDSCEVSVLRQRTFSDFLLDIGWALREPLQEDIHRLSSSQIERFNCLLDSLIQNESSIILERVLQRMEILMDSTKLNSQANDTTDAHMTLIQKNMDRARDVVQRKLQKEGDSVVRSGNLVLKGDSFKRRSENGMHPVLPTINQEMELAEDTSIDKSETLSLLSKEVAMNVNLVKENPMKPCNPIFPNTVLTSRRKPFCRIFPNTVLPSRRLIFVISVAAVCCGVCAVLLHPQKAGQLTVTIRRCLFDDD